MFLMNKELRDRHWGKLLLLYIEKVDLPCNYFRRRRRKARKIFLIKELMHKIMNSSGKIDLNSFNTMFSAMLSIFHAAFNHKLAHVTLYYIIKTINTVFILSQYQILLK